MRSADVGGWTDTWFSRTGVVCNIALDERAMVRVSLDAVVPVDADSAVDDHVELCVALYRDAYVFQPDEPPARHPMLEAAIAALPPPPRTRIEIGDELEPGTGLGSSAAVMVALVAALTAARGEPLDPATIARTAHRCEVSSGRQSGVQDHIASAFGGVSIIDVEYPEAVRRAAASSAATIDQLELRLLTVTFGAAHASSEMHDEVISRLAGDADSLALHRIRCAARGAVAALELGDLDAYGAALIDNNEAMRMLHPAIVSDEAEELIELAKLHGAVGWKVNGAGGAGGSMVVLAGADRRQVTELCTSIPQRWPWRIVEVGLDREGIRVDRRWERRDL